ncbi:hypothetical protein GBA52_027827 [Prunus armeniaca]|nr:hypothetical protein GBA52_027827 [Prunus armeniaca]
MADFQTSTHQAKWIFKPEELVGKYKAANQRAIQTLEKYGATLMEVDVDGTISYPEPQVIAKDNADKHSRPKPVSIEEEQFMRVFYENKLQEVCKNFHFPHKVQATALIYFKRFYLQWSVMQHHPKNIMLTCIYAACKIEENHVSAEELGKGISQDHHMILNNEMIVYQPWILEFDLIVYAPYRSIEGFIDDMGEFCGINDDRLQILQGLIGQYAVPILEEKSVWGTDAPTRIAYMDTQDVARLTFVALRNEKVNGKLLTFAGPRAWTTQEVITLCERFAGQEANVTTVPVSVLRVTRQLTRLFEWTNDVADRLAFSEVLSSDTVFSVPMNETFSLLGVDGKDIVTLEKYLQDYFTNILKKLKDLKAQSKQSDIYF